MSKNIDIFHWIFIKTFKSFQYLETYNCSLSTFKKGYSWAWLRYGSWTTRAQKSELFFNPLSANSTKWPNTFKQFVGNLPANCLCVFDHFVELPLKGLTIYLVNISKPMTLLRIHFSLFEFRRIYGYIHTWSNQIWVLLK